MAPFMMVALCHWMFEPSFSPSAPPWLAVAAMGLGPAGAASFLWDHGVKHGDLRLLGTLAYMTPLASTLLLVAFGQGALDARVGAAALLIVGGAALGTVRRRASASVSRPVSG